MTSNDTYHGWTNRETWCVALWLNNDEVLQESAQSACNTDGEMLWEAAETLEHYIDDLIEDESDVSRRNGFARDLINCALVRCDFRAIAETFREVAK